MMIEPDPTTTNSGSLLNRSSISNSKLRAPSHEDGRTQRQGTCALSGTHKRVRLIVLLNVASVGESVLRRSLLRTTKDLIEVT
jgi:hypothetical protein